MMLDETVIPPSEAAIVTINDGAGLSLLLPNFEDGGAGVDGSRAGGRRAVRSDLVDLLLFEHHRTDAAVLVSDTGEERKAVWLPLSQVEIEAKSTKVGGNEILVTLPSWLAQDKRLI